MATTIAEFDDNLSPNSATVAVLGDSRRIERQSPVLATVYIYLHLSIRGLLFAYFIYHAYWKILSQLWAIGRFKDF